MLAVPEGWREDARKDLAALSAAGISDREGLLAATSRADLGAELRVTACWAAARLGDPRAAGALRGALGDPEETVRWTAARGLGLCGRGQADADALAGALADAEPAVRRSALAALGNLKGAVEPLLLRVLADTREDPVLRGTAAEQLVYRTDAPGVAGALIASLSDRAADVRFWAAYALGESREERALEPLASLLNDETVVEGWGSVGREAAWAIERIRLGWEPV